MKTPVPPALKSWWLFSFKTGGDMRAIIFSSLLLLTACSGGGVHTVLETTPGSALPAGIAVCNQRDAIGRCSEWSSRSDQCVNPKGMNEPKPVVPCTTLKQ